MPLVAFCLRHFSADFIICMCVFDFRQAQRVLLFEDEHGRGIFEYDRPSSFFGQYGDELVTEVGRYLDATLEAVLRNAAD
ncbi:MAG TPA: hypothetical protein VNZ53_11585 [Steroidobacteraceae bacterium]|nr:hypothetical protein [Steroidobacteraceae bacterium]